MNTKLLLPNKFKSVGWCLLISGIIGTLLNPDFIWLNAHPFGIVYGLNGPEFFGSSQNNLTNELFWSLTIVGGIFVAFSKEKSEDEFIASLRLSSFMWAVFINYAILLFAVLFIYDIPFTSVMISNMFTVLLIFIGRFNYVLYRTTRKLVNEKYN